jgi:hypothetical protein
MSCEEFCDDVSETNSFYRDDEDRNRNRADECLIHKGLGIGMSVFQQLKPHED